MYLCLLLPMVEGVSQLIRPFTLIIRLRTNLAAGHILIYMFRYFAMLSASLAPSLAVVLVILYILEFCICLLQAYIFVTLVSLYVVETVQD